MQISLQNKSGVHATRLCPISSNIRLEVRNLEFNPYMYAESLHVVVFMNIVISRVNLQLYTGLLNIFAIKNKNVRQLSEIDNTISHDFNKNNTYNLIRAQSKLDNSVMKIPKV
jgi:hypothetical protein